MSARYLLSIYFFIEDYFFFKGFIYLVILEGEREYTHEHKQGEG